jgi:exopolysaccharide biosynthesis polyprenyl glycosylphosphotransferase
MAPVSTTQAPDVVLPEAMAERRRRRRLASRMGHLRLHATPALVGADLVACLATYLLTRPDLRSFAAQVALTLAAFAGLRLYRRRLSLAVLDDVPSILGAVAFGQLAVVAVAATRSAETDTVRALVTTGVLLASVIAVRNAAFVVAKRLRRHEEVHDNALIIGAGHVGILLGEVLQEHTEYGVSPVGYIDSNPRVGEGDRLPAPLLGGYETVASVIEEYDITYVIVAFGGLREEPLVDILRTCDRLDVEVLIVPRLFELHNATRDSDDVWGVPLVRVRRAAFRSPAWRIKRMIDVAASGIALFMLAPVMAAIALAVRYEGGPDVVFRQTRVGLDERPFKLLKFRSMRPATDAESQTQWNIKHDSRLGPVGKFLRRTSLDELPQLWNILRGDMSLVGPRPERPHFVQQFSNHVPRYPARHRVPSGLTGWAQVHGLRGDTSIEARAKFDNYYIENWSVWLDIKIMCRTVNQVLTRAGG